MDTNNEYGTLNIQIGLLKLIKTFDDFCSNNNVHYSLAYGSLLGAVRHKGFIPWDDDLDIIVDRENHQKLLNLLPSGVLMLEHNDVDSLWIDKVRLANYYDEDGFQPTLDIFPIDNVPDNKFAWKMELLGIKLLQGMIKGKPNYSKFSFPNKILSYVAYNIGKPFRKSTKVRWYNKLSQVWNGKKTANVTCNFIPYGYLGHIYRREVFDSFSRLPFEDFEICSISLYDEFLTETYGDYMTPPKDKDRIPKHK